MKSIAPDVPVCVVPHPVATHQASPRKAAGGGPFTVLTIFDAASSFARKNPCAAIRAFRLAFGDDRTARLIVKAAHLSAFPRAIAQIEDAKDGAGNVVVIDGTLSQSQMDGLYAEAHVVLSLHRSEGFGLVLAEAMVRKLPVIATGWSGNVDFLTPRTGVPVSYQLVPARDPQGTYDYPEMEWAEANVGEAATALRRVRDDLQYGRLLGSEAARFAAGAFGPEAYAGLVRQRLGW
jgi:glycosyltransferase involved in cell wall biosynthesis